MTTHTTEPVVLPSPRRWPALLAGIAVGIGGTTGAALLLDSSSEATTDSAGADLELSTAAVETRDLIEEVEWVADLGYGTAVDVRAPADGTVTFTAPLGTVLRRGDVVVEIDEVPVVVLYGTIPAWRSLAQGDEGADVEQLETNLVALGYDPDGLVSVDEEFTARTEDMVERWQEDLGVEETGVFSTESAVVVDGPVSVTTAPTIGDPAKSGDALAGVSARAHTTTIIASHLGELTELAAVGTPIEHGTVLYVADGVEVRALTALAAVDGLTDDGTERDYVLVPEGRTVSAQLVDSAAVLDIEHPVLELSTQTLSVVVPVGLADQGDWTVGQTVGIELPDETIVAGAVIEVGTVARTVEQGEEPTIDVTIEITELVADDLPASEVTVIVDGESVLGATVVPTRALVTLAEGGFAVERVLADDTTELVGVETGTFDDGVVEVTDSVLAPGDLVVVPR